MEEDNKFGFEDESDWSIESNYKSRCERDENDKGDEGNGNLVENQEDKLDSNIGNFTYDQIMSLNFEYEEKVEEFYRNLGKVLK